MKYIEHTVPNPFGAPVKLRLYDDGRMAIEGEREWQGVKQKAWIPIPRNALQHRPG